MTNRLGVIADTHGWLREEAVRALQGCEMIIHAGDIGKPEVLEGLQRIAPVLAVRGNVDAGAWSYDLPYRRTVAIGNFRLRVLHIREEFREDAVKEGYQAVIYGHSHRPEIEHIGGVLYLNPGSAGPQRFTLPVSLAILSANDRQLTAEIVTLAA